MAYDVQRVGQLQASVGVVSALKVDPGVLANIWPQYQGMWRAAASKFENGQLAALADQGRDLEVVFFPIVTKGLSSLPGWLSDSTRRAAWDAVAAESRGLQRAVIAAQTDLARIEGARLEKLITGLNIAQKALEVASGKALLDQIEVKAEEYRTLKKDVQKILAGAAKVFANPKYQGILTSAGAITLLQQMQDKYTSADTKVQNDAGPKLREAQADVGLSGVLYPVLIAGGAVVLAALVYGIQQMAAVKREANTRILGVAETLIGQARADLDAKRISQEDYDSRVRLAGELSKDLASATSLGSEMGKFLWPIAAVGAALVVWQIVRRKQA